MLRKPLLTFLLALVLVAIFAGGLARLFVLRYQAGDTYPHYSSLRADPLGTKALAAALAELPGVVVQQNFKPLPKLRPPGPVTLVYAGVTHDAYWASTELLTFDSLVADGSRAIFTFVPVPAPPSKHEEDQAEAEEHRKKEAQTQGEGGGRHEDSGKKKDSAKHDEKPAKSHKEDDSSDEPLIDFATVAKRWGFRFGWLPEEKGQPHTRYAALAGPHGDLESDITWHSTLDFEDLKPQWKVLYRCEGQPVIIERQYGKGSIVLAADSFFLSNEALRSERHPQLLSHLFSGPPAIVFDEEHNNLREDPGIASLVRKYRLHGVVAGLVLLAVLFVWKNVVRFVPAYRTSEAERDFVTGKESTEGFVNLLRRSIAPAALLETCLTEWRKAFAQNSRELEKVQQVWNHEQSRPARERDPVAAYRTISKVLARNF